MLSPLLCKGKSDCDETNMFGAELFVYVSLDKINKENGSPAFCLCSHMNMPSGHDLNVLFQKDVAIGYHKLISIDASANAAIAFWGSTVHCTTINNSGKNQCMLWCKYRISKKGSEEKCMESEWPEHTLQQKREYEKCYKWVTDSQGMSEWKGQDKNKKLADKELFKMFEKSNIGKTWDMNPTLTLSKIDKLFI
ncbi:MAG: hypothetical protein GY941_29425 [Planctomycetes bacterium]|nr:hypothetical protein [Planctomycetota bacterium]